MDVGDDWAESGGNAAGDFDPVAFLFDLFGHFAEVVEDGFSRGKIFPLDRFAVEVVLIVARFEVLDGRVDDAALDDAATDTGREGEVNREAGEVFGFGDAGKIGVVFEEDGHIEEFFEFSAEVKIGPGQVAEP